MEDQYNVLQALLRAKLQKTWMCSDIFKLGQLPRPNQKPAAFFVWLEVDQSILQNRICFRNKKSSQPKKGEKSGLMEDLDDLRNGLVGGSKPYNQLN